MDIKRGLSLKGEDIAFLKSVALFSNLPENDLADLLGAAKRLAYELGDTIFEAGETPEGICVVRRGMVRLFTTDQGREVSQGLRKAGDVFAEVAAISALPIENFARASGKTEILLIPRSALADVLEKNPEARKYITSYIALRLAGGFVSRLFALEKKVPPDVLEELVASIGVKKIGAGKVIVEQDASGEARLFAIRHGRVELSRQESGETFNLATLGPGEVFGEKPCLTGGQQPVSAVAVEDTVLLVIPGKTVNAIMEHNPRLRDVLEERIQFLDRELLRQKKLLERRKRPIMFDLRSEAGRGEKVIKRFPLVPQAEEMDCGAACLAMICKHYGIPVSLGKLREMANVTTEGATMESLARVGESLGFATRGTQCTFGALLGFRLPFIAHWEGYHYIVVYGISKRHVWVADPGPGFRKLTVEEFEKGWSGTCLLFEPGSGMAAPVTRSRSPWARFVDYLRPYQKVLGHLFVATLIIQLLGVAPPVITQIILDQVIVHNDVPLLNLLIVGLVITTVFSQLTMVLRAFLANHMVRSLDFSMMSSFFKHVMSLPISFFHTRKVGDIVARFQENQTIRAFLTESTITSVLNLLMVFIYFTILFIYSATLTWLLIAFVVPILLLTVLVTPRLKQYARDAFAASTEAESILMETLSGAETVKGMGLERQMRLKWESKYAKALDVQYRAHRFGILAGFASQLLNAATTVVILWIGANLVLANELTIGQLIAFNALMGSVMTPLMGLVGLWTQINEAGVAMERLGDILDIEPEQKPEDVPSRVMLPDLEGRIVFENVYFRYDSSGDYVLENIDLSIEPGQTVAIVGLSGSGKTTLAKLIVGFYEPTEGRIMVDGYDLSHIDKEYYRAQVGYVMQSNLLFSGTILENIAAGDENPDRRRVIEVARLADAHGFVQNLPMGYQTVVGERGMGLSGGQVQRLCIARALYHDPRLLILDEATSALDTQSEGNILSNMQKFLQGRTAVVIAHRLSTIMHADKILVLYEGAIVEQGTHQELLDRQGMYYQLVQKQLSDT